MLTVVPGEIINSNRFSSHASARGRARVPRVTYITISMSTMRTLERVGLDDCQSIVLGSYQEQERKEDRMNAYYMIQDAPYSAKSVEHKRFASFDAAAAVARLVLADFVVRYVNDEPQSVYMLEDDVWL